MKVELNVSVLTLSAYFSTFALIAFGQHWEAKLQEILSLKE